MSTKNLLSSATVRLLLLFFLVCTHGKTVAHDLDSIYAVLDAEVRKSDTYIYNKEKRIADLEDAVKRSRSNVESYDMNMFLYEELSSYDNARAKDALHKCLAFAEKLGSRERQAEVYSRLAYQNSMAGYYTEALNWLGRINEHELPSDALPYYYFVYAHVYGELGTYSDDATLAQDYYHQSDLYVGRFFAVADLESSFYRQRMASFLINNNRLEEADSLCRRWEQTINADVHDYAIMAYYRSEICRARHDVHGQCWWLALSAISDCRNAVMNQASLWSLAQQVSGDGNMKRSLLYVEYSWMFATKFGGHTRSWQVSPIITAIDENYRNELNRTNLNLTVLLTMASVLAVLFLVSLLFAYKRNHQLYAARNQLRSTNAELENLNRQLCDSNRVKDEYIGRFLSLCSKYIDKMDAYRMKVYRRVKAGQLKELQSMTSSDELCNEEAKELFANFDAVFLRLYPNFVEDFNALLRPEYHQSLGANNELTTDMRMAALIRLGINDSANIAEFLRLSPNTVYNYRARLKSRCVGDRNTFEDRIRAIGL